MLLWSLEETAKQLGGVSVRTIRRMLEQRKIMPVYVLGRVLVAVDSVNAFVASQAQQVHNPECVGSVAWKGNDPCYENAKAHRTGGQTTPMQAAKELDALLEQVTRRKLKR
jgi:hypothetical protein